MTGSGGGPSDPQRAAWFGRALGLLRSHPTKRPWANWVIWSVAAILLISVAANAGASHKPSGTTATLGSGSSSTTVTTSAPTTVAPSPTTTTESSPSTTPSEATGTVVVNSAGAVLPNSQRTPGATNPQVTQADIGSTICTSGWTSTIRPPSSYTTPLKEQQLSTGYAYNGDTNPSDYEEDHLISLELGGSPTSVLNLWPEPYNVADGARTKDQIENKLNSLVCAGSVSLARAQQMIASNWFVAYETYIGSPAGSTAPPATTASTSPPVHPASLTCTASMSNSTPSDNSTDDVYVRTAAGATVSATAHYKSTNTTHTGAANGSGMASVVFDIGRATVGYTVQVDVTVSLSGESGSCSTQFTPH